MINDNELMKALGNSLEKQEISMNSDNQDFNEISKEKIESLKEAIFQIEKQITEREALSKQVLLEAEKIKMDANNFITDKQFSTPDILREQIMLKQKQVEVSELQLKEKISCWQDTNRLKEELREKKRDLTDKQSRFEMLSNILKE